MADNTAGQDRPLSFSGERDGPTRERFSSQGYEFFQRVVGWETIESLKQVLNVESGRAGQRRLLGTVPMVDDLCYQGELHTVAHAILGAAAFPVRAILFDKTPDANWSVPWHQDLAIPVREKKECDGFVGWSQKEGVWHVCPPASILASMVTLRLHVDDCSPANGPLRVLPASHRFGALSVAQVTTLKDTVTPIVCVAGAGDVLAMRPLLLHASSVAEVASHRRVLHVEYAHLPLPGGLAWATGIG